MYMENDMQKRRIDDVLDSIEGIQRANAPESLFAAIEQHIDANVKRVIPIRTVMAAAASIMLLLSVNVYLLSNTSNAESLSNSDMKSVIEYYELGEQSVNFNI